MKWKGHHDLGLDGLTRVAYFTAQFRNFHDEPEDKHEKFTTIVVHWPEFELCPHPPVNTNIYVYWHQYLLCEEQCYKFNVHGFVHRKYIPLYIQQDATLHSLFMPGNCSTCFGWYNHPSSGAQTTVSTASGICHTLYCYLPL